MEENNYQKILEEKFSQLPELVQKIIIESNWIDSIRKIAERYSLRIDQGDVLQRETMLVMFGFEETTQFLENIIREAGLKRMTAIEIAREIDSLIFDKIKEAIIEEGEKELSKNSEKKNIDNSQTEQLNRENILEEIEKTDQIEQIKEAEKIPATITKPNETALQNPIVKNSEIVKIDPYREEVK